MRLRGCHLFLYSYIETKESSKVLLLLLRFQSLFFLPLVLCLIWSGTQVAIRGRFAKPLVGVLPSESSNLSRSAIYGGIA